MTSLVTEQRLAPCLTLSLLALLANVRSSIGWYTCFPNGHFCSLILRHNLPFWITIACNPYESGLVLFQEFATGTRVFGSGNDLLNHIRASGETPPIHGYLSNSYQFQTREVTSSFWKLQLLIIAQLHLIHLLSVVVAVIIQDHDRRSVTAFV